VNRLPGDSILDATQLTLSMVSVAVLMLGEEDCLHRDDRVSGVHYGAGDVVLRFPPLREDSSMTSQTISPVSSIERLGRLMEDVTCPGCGFAGERIGTNRGRGGTGIGCS
jgi:hypothetical protein